MISATLSHTLTTPITCHGLAIHSGSLRLTGSDRARADKRNTGKTRSRDEAQHPPGHDYGTYGRASHLHCTSLKQTAEPAKPSEYDGNHANGHNFVQSCSLCLGVCASDFPDEQSQILWALFFMKTGRAATFATHAFTYKAKNGTPLLKVKLYNKLYISLVIKRRVRIAILTHLSLSTTD